MKEDWISEPCYWITQQATRDLETWNIGAHKVMNIYNKERKDKEKDCCIITLEGEHVITLKAHVPVGTTHEALCNLIEKGNKR